MLQSVLEWGFGHGLVSLRLDVAAPNGRAIRCYQKAGFKGAGEIWRSAPDLQDVDVSRSMYDFLRPHVRSAGSHEPQIRFLIMEAACR